MVSALVRSYRAWYEMKRLIKTWIIYVPESLMPNK